VGSEKPCPQVITYIMMIPGSYSLPLQQSSKRRYPYPEGMKSELSVIAEQEKIY